MEPEQCAKDLVGLDSFAVVKPSGRVDIIKAQVFYVEYGCLVFWAFNERVLALSAGSWSSVHAVKYKEMIDGSSRF